MERLDMLEAPEEVSHEASFEKSDWSGGFAEEDAAVDGSPCFRFPMERKNEVKIMENDGHKKS
jgi:hypothetical protein